MDSKEKYLEKIRKMNVTSDEGSAALNLLREADAAQGNRIMQYMSTKSKLDKSELREPEPENFRKLPLPEQERIKEIMDYNSYMRRRNKLVGEKNKKILGEQKAKSEKFKNAKWYE